MSKKSSAGLVIAAGVLWGSISIFVNGLNAYSFSGAEICFLLVLSCAVLLMLFLLLYDRRLFKINPRDLWMFVGTGIVSLTLFSDCYFTTIISSGASVAVSLLYTSPVFVMLFSALLFRERITLRKAVAIILTVIGCALVSGIVGSTGGMEPVSLLTGIGAGVFYALYSIFGRYATEKYHPFTITFYTFVFASLGFLLLVNPFGTVRKLVQFPQSILTVTLLGLVCGVLPYIFYTTGLKHLDTTTAGVLAAVEPLVGSIVGIIGFRESADPLKILGILMILSSIVLLGVSMSQKRPDNSRK